MISITASIFSFIYILLVAFIFFSKARIKNKETTIFTYLLVTSVVGIFLDSVSGLLYLNGYNFNSILYHYLTKLILLFYVVWDMMLLEYIVVISKPKEKIDKYLKIITICIYIFGIVMIISPLKIISDGINAHPEGVGIIIMYIITLVLTLITIFSLVENFRNLKNKKYLPLFLYLLFGILMLVVQNLTGILLMTSVDVFITILMFFTIENPDIKLLEEVHKSKEISDAANEEKTLFLYNMTQEIRSTTNEIDDNADIILDSDSIDTDKNCAREIKGITSKFRTITNEMFDVSKLDSASIKVYNSKYNIKNILKEIVTMYSKICKDKNIDFRVNIDRDVPEVLYGDSIDVKEVLSIIMDNSVKYTKEGFIEFSVSTIIKNDVCRLIITIEDSGVGIKSDDINKIKIGDKSLSKANKLVTLMNGAMMVSSNYGMGTKVKVILDQKIEINVNKDIAKYSEIYDNIKILMVDDSEAGIKIIEKLIKGSNIKMDFAMNGRECIDKIKMYGKYDAILLDEQLTQINASELLTKIKTIRNFNIPVILLTKDNSYEYNDEYKKLGFSDYILKPVMKDELLRKTKMYVRKNK